MLRGCCLLKEREAKQSRAEDVLFDTVSYLTVERRFRSQVNFTNGAKNNQEDLEVMIEFEGRTIHRR